MYMGCVYHNEKLYIYTLYIRRYIICNRNNTYDMYMYIYIYILETLPASPARQEMAGLVKDHPEFPDREVAALGTTGHGFVLL